MSAWKTPSDYIESDILWHCSQDMRAKVGCTKKFHELGLFDKTTWRWDLYGQYRALCKDCPNYTHGIGIYFGRGKYTENIGEADIAWCRGRITNESELCDFLSVISPNVKAIGFDDVRTESLAVLETLGSLECVLIGYCQKLCRFWNFEKTPSLKVLEVLANPHLTDLSELSSAQSLEYLGITTLTGRLDKLSFVESFYPLTHLSSLRELSLECVMCRDENIDNIINIPKLERLWISPHTFSNEAFAKFEAQKFKIGEEYGIYQNGEDYIRPLGRGGRCFRSEKAKEKYIVQYLELMEKFSKK